MEYDRRVLIVDGPEGSLQQLALELLGRDLGVHYVNDPAEAQLLAQEARGHIGAVLYAPSAELGPIPDMARRLSVRASALIPTGERPAKSEVAAMSCHGVRWHLWNDPSDETIRFVLASVMSDHDAMELRFHTRVPTRLSGSLQIDDLKGDVTIRDLSPGGACLLGRIVGEADARGHLSFSIDETELSLPVLVAWCVDGASDGTSDEVGVAGVAFIEVDPESGTTLDRHLESIIAEQRVDEPRSPELEA